MHLSVPLIALLALLGTSPVRAQVPITAPWTETTSLPEASYYTQTVSYENHVIVFKCWPAPFKVWVGDVGPSGTIASWRETLPPPAPFPSFFMSGIVRINEFIVIPLAGNSFIGRLGPDGSIVSWNTAPGTPNPSLTARAVAADGNRIYSIAGNIAWTLYQGVDTATIDSAGNLSPWRSLNPTPIPLLDPMAVAMNGYLYVFGGSTTDPYDLTPGGQVRRAPIQPDGSIGDWQLMDGTFINPRPHANYLRNNGTLHILGGGVHTYMTNTVESVLEGDLGQPGRSVLSTPLPTILNQMGTAVVGNYAYAMGGVTAQFGTTWTNKVWFTKLNASAPPVIQPTVSGLQGQNGWYRDTVTVNWSVADSESGILSSAGCAPSTVTNETPGLTLTCSATNNNGLTASSSVTIKLDRTPPSISASRAPLPNAAGWNNTDVTATFSCTDALSGTPTSAPFAVILSSEGANQSAPGTCTDNAGNTASTALSGINIDKTPPALTALNVSPNPQIVGSSVSLTARLTDALSGFGSWRYSISGASPVSFNASGTDSAVAAQFTQPNAGVYPVCARAIDAAGNTSAEDCLYAVFYDPGAGFVTGGGWFNSPAGAYAADPALSGKATFGFVSRYQPGATIPSGNTEFQFKAGNLNFKSTSYDWLVVAGSKAQFKGSGTINGSGNYEFMITATDGDNGPGSSDRIRVRIVQKSGGIVYDNQTSASDDSDPVTALGGGSIVIHR